MRILQGLLLSLGVHFLLVWGSQFLPAPHVSNRETIEIEVLPLSEQKNATGQTVRQSLVPDDFKVDDNDDPRFLSEKSQRVRKQQQAAQSGKTENRSPGLENRGNAATDQTQRQASSRGEPEQETPQERTNDPDLFAVRKPRFPKQPRGEESDQLQQALRRGNNLPRYQDLPQGFSTVGESLPRELEVGHFTALNTDRYLFYSFFMRIEDLIRYDWENQVKYTIVTTPRGVFQAQASDNWVTQVEIQLRPNGEFHRALLLKSSNVPGFDRAAVESFARARLFPNPPQEMVEDDGLIHLKYSFTVRYQPRGMVENQGR